MEANKEQTAEAILRKRVPQCIWGDEGGISFMLDTVPALMIINVMQEYAALQLSAHCRDKELELGLVKIQLEHTKRLLASCENALTERDASREKEEWVSVETPPVDGSTYPDGSLPKRWQVATDDDILLLPCQYYNGKWHPYGQFETEHRVKYYRPLPSPPTKQTEIK